MFKYSIDDKPQINDPNGNTIIDLTDSMFSMYTEAVTNYQVKKVTKLYNMRPDLVSLGEYGSTDQTEYILKYSGISNPFSFGENDLLIIPQQSEAENQMKANNPTEKNDETTKQTEIMIKNFFKFHNNYTNDFSSYDNLTKLNVPSGNIDPSTSTSNYSVPYISDDGETAVTVKNGKVYFGTNSGVTSASDITTLADLDNQIQNIINNAQSVLSDASCLTSGQTLASLKSTLNSNN